MGISKNFVPRKSEIYVGTKVFQITLKNGELYSNSEVLVPSNSEFNKVVSLDDGAVVYLQIPYRSDDYNYEEAAYNASVIAEKLFKESGFEVNWS